LDDGQAHEVVVVLGDPAARVGRAAGRATTVSPAR
jgi:hypothetical protein